MVESKQYSIVTLLDRYILSQFFGPFLLAVGGFLIIAMIDILYYLMELLVISKVGIWTLTKILLFKLPEIMTLFFPMAVLFSTLLMLIRMIKDNELTILRSSGIPLIRIILPLFIALITTTSISYIFYDSIVPKTNHLFQKVLFQEIKKKPPPTIEENVFFKVLDDRYFYIKKVNKKTNEFFDIMIFKKTDHLPTILTAQKGIWKANEWILLNGKNYHFEKDGYLSFTEEFDQLKINTEQEALYYFRKHKTPREMNAKELKKQINLNTKSGLNTRSHKTQYHLLKSIPFSCLVFGLIGISLCLRFTRSSKDWWGVIITICTSVLSVGFYFFLVALFRAFSKSGAVIPIFGAWFPNILYASICILLLRKTFKTT